MLKSKTKRIDINLRGPQRRKNFFEKKEANESKIFLRIITRFLFFVFAGVTLYILFFSPFLQINKVAVEGNFELKSEDIEQNIWQNFEGKYFRIIPKNNLILSFPGTIKTNLLNDFKKISEAEVVKIFPNEIKVKMTERKSLLLWCSAGPCYFIDENGYAYAWADFESEEIRQNHLINLIDRSGKPVVLGERVLTSDYIQFVSDLKDKLNSLLEIKIGQEYQTDSRIAEEVRVKTDQGWEIFFSSTFPMNDSLRTLKTFVDKEMADKDMSKLEYVDLRAENKVYYKFRDESQTDTDLTQADVDSAQTDEDNQKDEKNDKDDKKKKD